MGVLKVADLRTEAELKYADLQLETAGGAVVSLRNLLRLDDSARRSAQVLIEALDKKPEAGTEGEGAAFDQLVRQEATLRDLFLLVADNRDEMRREVEGWDLAMRLLVMERWMEGTQAGEASSSAS
ncbi:phage tail assembly protein [Streptomyces sp. x-80]|uniref:phage tail assembly protein n=1 Tax=Streptomyces sp. x-80 TaxID=2789282 RepID=UPI0039811CC5